MIRSGTTWDRMIRYVEGLSADEANRARPEFVRRPTRRVGDGDQSHRPRLVVAGISAFSCIPTLTPVTTRKDAVALAGAGEVKNDAQTRRRDPLLAQVSLHNVIVQHETKAWSRRRPDVAVHDRDRLKEQLVVKRADVELLDHEVR